MKWIDPEKQLPENGQIIWILLKHWKEEGSLSCEIYSGEVWEAAPGILLVDNNDYIGQGSQRWHFNKEEYGCDAIYAWAPRDEIPVPIF